METCLVRSPCALPATWALPEHADIVAPPRASRTGRPIAQRPTFVPLNEALPHADEPPRWPELAPAMIGRRFSLRPGRSMLDRLLGAAQPDIARVACERWQVAPRSCAEVRPALVLPGQLARLADARSDTPRDVLRHLKGGFDVIEAPTIGYCFRNVLLHDGTLHASSEQVRGAVRPLRSRSGFSPLAIAPREVGRMAIYESLAGNRSFASWLGDDCLTYRLAEAAGQPFATLPALLPIGHGTHVADYESALSMAPARGASVLFDDLILFDDAPQNDHKRARADDMRRRLTSRPVERHAGVFLLSGSGARAGWLANETAVAEHLAIRHGLRILDPASASLPDIARACGGAEVVAGAAGDHLVHGLMTMPPDARAFVIHPPLRASSALKRFTDRQGQDYALVVAKGAADGFTADIAEIERTLGLF